MKKWIRQRAHEKQVAARRRSLVLSGLAVVILTVTIVITQFGDGSGTPSGSSGPRTSSAIVRDSARADSSGQATISVAARQISVHVTDEDGTPVSGAYVESMSAGHSCLLVAIDPSGSSAPAFRICRSEAPRKSSALQQFISSMLGESPAWADDGTTTIKLVLPGETAAREYPVAAEIDDPDFLEALSQLPPVGQKVTLYDLNPDEMRNQGMEKVGEVAFDKLVVDKLGESAPFIGWFSFFAKAGEGRFANRLIKLVPGVGTAVSIEEILRIADFREQVKTLAKRYPLYQEFMVVDLVPPVRTSSTVNGITVQRVLGLVAVPTVDFATASGMVTGKNGHVLERVPSDLTVVFAGDGGTYSSHVVAGGNYRLDHVHAGMYDVRVTEGGSTLAERKFMVFSSDDPRNAQISFMLSSDPTTAVTIVGAPVGPAPRISAPPSSDSRHNDEDQILEVCRSRDETGAIWKLSPTPLPARPVKSWDEWSANVPSANHTCWYTVRVERDKASVSVAYMGAADSDDVGAFIVHLERQNGHWVRTNEESGVPEDDY